MAQLLCPILLSRRSRPAGIWRLDFSQQAPVPFWRGDLRPHSPPPQVSTSSCKNDTKSRWKEKGRKGKWQIRGWLSIVGCPCPSSLPLRKWKFLMMGREQITIQNYSNCFFLMMGFIVASANAWKSFHFAWLASSEMLEQALVSNSKNHWNWFFFSFSAAFLLL